MNSGLIAVLLISLQSLVSGKHLLDCEFGKYFNKESKSCVTCTVCTGFSVVKEPCGVARDTVCWQISKDILQQDQFSFLRSKPKLRSKTAAPKPKDISTPDFLSQVEMLSSENWYTISMVLLALLCLLSAGIALYIVFACFICRKSEKDIIYQPEFINRRPDIADDDEPRYVETYISSRDRLKSHSNVMSRIYVNDITSVSPLLLPSSTENIYVNCSNLDDRNSTPSSDYVYLSTTH